MKLLLILGVSLTFLTAIFTSGYNDKPGTHKSDVLLSTSLFINIYNTHFPHHILIKGGYNNNLVQTSHSFPSKIVFVPLFLPLLQLHSIPTYELDE